MAGEELANAMMKAETKAKRRVTLSKVLLLVVALAAAWVGKTRLIDNTILRP